MMGMPMMMKNRMDCCGCDCCGGRRFLSKEEQKKFLQEYKEELEKEMKAVQEAEKELGEVK